MMPPLIARLCAARNATIAEVTAGCHRLGIEPLFERGLEGTYARDPTGRNLATLRLLASSRETCVLRLEVHCDRLRAAMTERSAQRMQL